MEVRIEVATSANRKPALAAPSVKRKPARRWLKALDGRSGSLERDT